ncbi:hypothetical protein [Arthrobacter woluwensis]|uniref:hypothetical protein n=1 Tax=Arthrobacter woluwensis TaxID=156980 RepID=UPI00380B2D7D
MGLFSCDANLLKDAHRYFATGIEPADRPKRGEAARKAIKLLSEEKARELVEHYRAGKNVYELGGEYGIHRTTASSILKHHGIKLRRTSPTEEQVAEMIRLYESGLSMARVGERFGVNGTTVLKYLKLHGVKTRDARGRSR